MRTFLTILLFLVTLVLCIVSFTALIEANAWWIRMTDFPRLQYSIALLGLLVLLAIAVPVRRRVRGGLALIALLALGYNAVKLAPYFFPPERVVEACPEGQSLSVMVANVQLGNRQSGELLKIVRDRSPDVFLALETDEWWDRQLASLSDAMPHSVAQITGSYFGMHLLSRLPLSETEVVFPVKQDAPSIQATVTLPAGGQMRFIGLHPRPPHPGESSVGRDAQLMWAAGEARGSERPVVLAGDLNAVPWERSVERLQRIGALIDPRNVEGFLPTYDAQSWWMSWPLDQVFHQKGLSMMSMTVLPAFGSDHYPVEVELCDRPSDRTAPEMRPDDPEEARTTIETAREAARGG